MGSLLISEICWGPAKGPAQWPPPVRTSAWASGGRSEGSTRPLAFRSSARVARLMTALLLRLARLAAERGAK
eukprot:2681775-Pyramimonas_sp.AAC.1